MPLGSCGYSQRTGRDYAETFSPFVFFKDLLSLLRNGAVKDYEKIIVDISNAFLETKLDLPINMTCLMTLN
jgi:hypothetical protein